MPTKTRDAEDYKEFSFTDRTIELNVLNHVTAACTCTSHCTVLYGQSNLMLMKPCSSQANMVPSVSIRLFLKISFLLNAKGDLKKQQQVEGISMVSRSYKNNK